jgi:hypothetical protein
LLHTLPTRPPHLASRVLFLPHAPTTHPHKSMRLLKNNKDGEFTIARFNNIAIPPYAILSHTWGANTEEVTFADLVKGGGQAKRGY